MRRQPLVIRLFITLIAAWYAGIASGQLSLAESLSGAPRSGGKGVHSPYHTSMAMVRMDCHGPSLPGTPKHPCTCIDPGCDAIGMAAPMPATTIRLACAEIRETLSWCYLTYTHRSPRYTLPFAHGPPSFAS